jgi:threonine aldolase
MVAELLEKEASMVVPSGTMGNLVSVKTQTDPGDEIILDSHSHHYLYEGGGYAAVAGVSVRFIQTDRGIIAPEQIPPGIRSDNVHFPRSKLVLIENTHNRGGGSYYTADGVAAISQVCREHGLLLHMDGARLWNACIATGTDPMDYTAHVDTVSVCLSKGLGCPVGSVVAGTAEFIRKARRVRKMLGGGMRQAGYLAAAGIYALENNIVRLAQDHENARVLAAGIRGIPSLELRYDPPDTNMVYFQALPPLDTEGLASALEERGILVGRAGADVFRAVTHLGVARSDIEHTVDAMREACAVP